METGSRSKHFTHPEPWKVGKPAAKTGLSRSHLAAAAKNGALSTSAVLAKKDSLAALTSRDISTVSSRTARPLVPLLSEENNRDSSAATSGSDRPANNAAPTKKALRATLNQTGGVTKKDRRRIRSELLHKRLAAAETVKKAAKAQKVREKAVIVKDLHPLIENLQDIEEDIRKVGNSG